MKYWIKKMEWSMDYSMLDDVMCVLNVLDFVGEDFIRLFSGRGLRELVLDDRNGVSVRVKFEDEPAKVVVHLGLTPERFVSGVADEVDKCLVNATEVWYVGEWFLHDEEDELLVA